MVNEPTTTTAEAVAPQAEQAAGTAAIPEAQHTPAPWNIDRWENISQDAAGRLYYQILGGNTETGVFFGGRCRPADATLVAAAPVMLQALQAHADFDRGALSMTAWLEQIEFAIRLATTVPTPKPAPAPEMREEDAVGTVAAIGLGIGDDDIPF